MKLSIILLVIFFIVALLGSIAGTSYYYIKSVDSVEEQVYFHLESIAQSRAHHIETWLKVNGKPFEMFTDSELEELNAILLDKTGLGETGETYLINKDSYAITSLLHVEDAVLKQKIDSINSRNCLGALDDSMEIQGEHVGHEAIEVFLDYRGEKVIGAHAPIPGTGWCLLAEIDEAEVLGKQRKLFQKVSLTIIIAILIITILFGLIIGKFVDDAVVLKKKKKSL